MTDIIEIAEKCGAHIRHTYTEESSFPVRDKIAEFLSIKDLEAFADAIRQDQIEKDIMICNTHVYAVIIEIRKQLSKQAQGD